MSAWVVAIEDGLSESVACRLLQEIGLTVGQVVGGKGKGYLKSRAPELNRASRGVSVLMIADQDSASPCPQEIIASWLGSSAREPRFLLRIATMEVEGWVMADREAFADFLRVPVTKIGSLITGFAAPAESIRSTTRRRRPGDTA